MIKATALTKNFGDKKALDSIDLTINDSSIYGLVGSNGSGKSTLMRLISGVYYADGGNISIDGLTPFNNPQLKARISYLADTPFFIHQSNINEMARFYKSMYPSFSSERFEKLANTFPLDRKARIATMSKGMQRQAALMLCLSTMPDYLLLDEAFDGLDPVMRKVLKSLLVEGASDGMTAIIASHNLRDLDELCDSVGLLHQGKILLNDEIDEIKSSIHKFQIVFDRIPDLSVFENMNVLKIEKSGSVVQLAVKGDKKEIGSFINGLFPVFVESIPPTFEEIFMYELEAMNYDAENLFE